MRRSLIAALLALLCAATQAAPCNPLLPSNRGLVAGTSAAAARYGAWWALADSGDWGLCVLAARSDYAIKHPAGLPATAMLAERVAAYYALNVAGGCGSNQPDRVLLAACDSAWFEAQATRPAPPYAVRSNGSYPTRPTYPLLAGKLGTASNGRVEIKDGAGRPTPCDPREQVKTSAGTYMRVKATPGTVTLCSAT